MMPVVVSFVYCGLMQLNRKSFKFREGMGFAQFKEENRAPLNQVYKILNRNFGVDYRHHGVLQSIDGGIRMFLAGEGICKIEKGTAEQLQLKTLNPDIDQEVQGEALAALFCEWLMDKGLQWAPTYVELSNLQYERLVDLWRQFKNEMGLLDADYDMHRFFQSGVRKYIEKKRPR